ncbi:hypothetical protein HY990_00750 [Candidatus Micrarchaeota archaeon]|nr:hypothetical protein [Candidatus Micrarchaeota archaeon]
MEVKTKRMKKNGEGEYEMDDDKSEKSAPQRPIIIEKEKGGIGWAVTSLICIGIILAIIHFSCQAGTATGYVGGICKAGLQLQDFIGIICCAPLYLLIIVLTSSGLRIW